MEFLIDSAAEVATNASEQSQSSLEQQPSLEFTKKSKGLRLRATRYFLTFPKNDTPKEVAMERLKEMFKDNLKGALICQEKHQGEASLFW